MPVLNAVLRSCFGPVQTLIDLAVSRPIGEHWLAVPHLGPRFGRYRPMGVQSLYGLFYRANTVSSMVPGP